MDNESQNALVDLSNRLAEAVEQAGRSTVLVDARRRIPASGIAYSPELVLTADHVVERDEEIQVGLPNGEQVPAVIAGRDPGNDLALLRLEGGRTGEGGLVPAEAASEPARVGQIVLGLGRPSQEGIQASLGIVSAMGGPVRTGRGILLEQYIRTDTIPYPGFSGGPLADAAGRIVGLNTSGLARGMALTIPISHAWKVAQALAENGHVRRGYLGVRSQPVELSSAMQQALGRGQETGLLLVNIEGSSPAAQGGLQVGDILVGLDGRQLADPDDLLVVLSGPIVGQVAQIEVLRGGQLQTLAVTIGERK